MVIYSVYICYLVSYSNPFLTTATANKTFCTATAGVGFASASNDSCVKVWSYEGEELASMTAPNEGGEPIL